MLRPSHRSFAWLSQDILSRLLVIDFQAGKFRTIPAMKYRPAVQPFSQKSLTATVPKVFQIGLCGVVEADLELFCNSWSVEILGERLYLPPAAPIAFSKKRHHCTSLTMMCVLPDQLRKEKELPGKLGSCVPSRVQSCPRLRCVEHFWAKHE